MSHFECDEVTYRVDAADVICFVSDEWLPFARANGACDLTATKVLGRPLWEFVTGLEVAHLYRLLIGVVRSQRRAATVPFRCDSPTVRRFMELVITPAGAEVEFCARLLRQENRDPVQVLDSVAARAERHITICSWCKRIQGNPGEWHELEEALARWSLVSAVPPPQLTHGMCLECVKVLQEQIEDGVASDAR